MSFHLDPIHKHDTKVVIYDSPVHGRGVFVTCDIKIGEYVCYYSGVNVIIEDFLKFDNRDEYVIPVPNESGKVRIGSKNFPDDQGIGQFINDSCYPSIPFENNSSLRDPMIYSYCETALTEYFHRSMEGRNVSFVHALDPWNIFAIKNISKGEELFIHYGSDQWLSHYCRQCKYPIWRLILAQLQSNPIVPSQECLTDSLAKKVIDNVLRIHVSSLQWETIGLRKHSPKEKIEAILQMKKIFPFNNS